MTPSYHSKIEQLYQNSVPLIGNSEVFNQLQIPNRKTEAWKYTDVSRLQKLDFILPKPKTDGITVETNDNEYLAVFINGHFTAEKSVLPSQKGVTVSSLKEAKQNHAEIIGKYLNTSGIAENDIFTAQNTAFATEGLFIHISKNTALDKPLKIMQYVTETDKNFLIQFRNLVVAESGSSISINSLEQSKFGVAEVVINQVTEVFVENNARLIYNVLQNESENINRLNTNKIVQHSDSVFTCNTFTINGKLIRNAINVDADGENCETHLNGFYKPATGQHFDNLTNIRHLKPHCRSNQLYKGIVGENATAVFNGKVFVAKEAQQTDAYQSNKNIALSETSSIHSRPQLEIYADDVKCSHGTTTGQLDQNAMFFMQARGIGKQEAKNLLLTAFAGEVVEKVVETNFKQLIWQMLY